MQELILNNPIVNYILIAIDILIITVIIYKVYLYIAHTRAFPVLKGIILILILTFVTKNLNLDTFNWLLEKFVEIILIAVLVLFPSEIRRGLYNLGKTNFFSNIVNIGSQNISNIIDAITYMSENKTGALIILERYIEIENIINSGVRMDSVISTELLSSIFYKNSPLHDGAVVIRRDRIVAASCYIPFLTNRPALSTKYGTRHRAAIGLSEEVDAFIIVVSEETGSIGVAYNNGFYPKLTVTKLRKMIDESFAKSNNKNENT